MQIHFKASDAFKTKTNKYTKLDHRLIDSSDAA
jgi:hypothetical protein